MTALYIRVYELKDCSLSLKYLQIRLKYKLMRL